MNLVFRGRRNDFKIMRSLAESSTSADAAEPIPFDNTYARLPEAFLSARETVSGSSAEALARE